MHEYIPQFVNGEVNATAEELGYCSGVTSSIQTQIDGVQTALASKAALAGAAFTGAVSVNAALSVTGNVSTSNTFYGTGTSAVFFMDASGRTNPAEQNQDFTIGTNVDVCSFFLTKRNNGSYVAQLIRVDWDTGWMVLNSAAAATAPLDINDDTIRLRIDRTPASNDPGNKGEQCGDANYLYRCVATNTWKRTPLESY